MIEQINLIRIKFQQQVFHQIMTWIWEECPDNYGHCIRQYAIFALSGIIAAISLYSTVRIYTKLDKYKFEMIPLSLNSLAALSMFGMFFLLELFNTHLIMMIIEIYSYSLLSYAYIGLYLRSSSGISRNVLRKWRISFILFSFLCLGGLAVMIYLTADNKINCKDQHGWGTIALFFIQLPIYIAAAIFIMKTKSRIRELQKYKMESEEEHLLEQEDLYIKIRYRQANFTLISFTVSLLLHMIAISLFMSGSTIKCDEEELLVNNGLELSILVIENFTQIIPHFVMPLIFYFIPERFHMNNPPVQIVARKVENSMNSNVISNYDKEVAIRKKYQNR